MVTDQPDNHNCCIMPSTVAMLVAHLQSSWICSCQCEQGVHGMACMAVVPRMPTTAAASVWWGRLGSCCCCLVQAAMKTPKWYLFRCLRLVHTPIATADALHVVNHSSESVYSNQPTVVKTLN
jgi:hypothetical protein